MRYYIPALLCGISIFWLSVTSGANLPETLKDLLSVDKLAHAVAYGTQAFLLFWAHQKNKGLLRFSEMLMISIGVAFYGFLMELIQYYFFPSRYFEVLDILANIMGIVIIHVIFNLLFNKTTAA